jgi:hypothetical protein
LALRVRASSTNSSSPPCRSRHSPPAMWSSCTCIAAPLSLLWPMKMSNKTLIAGVRLPPGDRSAGRSSRNGYGTRLLELGHQLEPTSLRTTEFAAAIAPVTELIADATARAPGYGPLTTATRLGKLAASRERTLLSSPMGRVFCPAGKTLHPTEQRIERDGSLRVLYAARIGDCRVCPLREQCQWHGHQTTKPRRVSLLLHPLSVGSAPLLWHDWSRRVHRRACMQRLASPTGGRDV